MDDLVTAYVAAAALEGAEPARALDMGCGIGSVLMMTAWRFPRARMVGVEAQALSAGMARRSLAWNGADDRCEVRLGDLRDPSVLDGERFELVTGTPPYFPSGEGIESTKPQCAPCRFEHRGGVEDYAAAAARALAPGGRFVMCAAAGEVDRVKRGARDAGLDLLAWLDVVPRAGKPPLVAVFTLAPARGVPSVDVAPESLVVRDERSAWTEAFANVRRAMGMPATPPGSRDPASP
jgi:tRNA1(Val) A37 N6-methylase TrmN6